MYVNICLYDLHKHIYVYIFTYVSINEMNDSGDAREGREELEYFIIIKYLPRHKVE